MVKVDWVQFHSRRGIINSIYVKMFLISSILLRRYILCFKFINLFYAFPCKWNSNRTGLIDYAEGSSPDKTYFRIWKLVNYVILLQGVLFAFGYFQEITELNSDSFGSFVLDTIMFLSFEWGAFLQFFLKMRGESFITCFNRFLKYFSAVQGMRIN